MADNNKKALKKGGHRARVKYWLPSKWKKDHWMKHEYIKTTSNVSEEWKFIFVGIAKNAGTSIRHGVLKKHIKDFIIYPGLQYPIYSSFYDDFFKFAFIRNPWDRFVSNYNYLEKHKYLPSKMPRNVTFKEFALNYAWDKNGEALNVHWLQQYYFIQDEEKCWIDFIGRYENLIDDFKIVLQRIGLSSTMRFPHLNRAQNNSEYKKYYDNETKVFIGEKYKKDIELYNYDF